MTAYRSPKYKKEKIQKETNCKTKKSNRQNEGGKKRWYAEALTKNKGEVQNAINRQDVKLRTRQTRHKPTT